ncbi:MAG: UV DNA damage repair endonuclease UvsE [Bacillota bacterium]
MPVRLGYVGINLTLQEERDGPRLRSVTAKRLAPMEPAERRRHLYQVARNNLKTLEAVIRWNHAHQIHLFRITSDLIPLATHPVAAEWDWEEDLADEFRACADLARRLQMRLTMHPGQYTVLNAPDPDVLRRAVEDLRYHARVLELLRTGPESGLVLHIGGGYREKGAAARRFVENFRALPPEVARRLWVENDDVTWDTAEVLQIAREVGRPMVFDLHHHRVLREDDWLPWLEEILPTWGGVRPKLHFSSPKDGLRSRHHADYIDPADFAAFLERVPDLEADVVLECKMKEKALLALRKALGPTRIL